MSSENKKSNQPIWLYAILGVLAIALVVLLVRNSSIKGDLQQLEAEKEMQRMDFQAEVERRLGGPDYQTPTTHPALVVARAYLGEEA